MRGLTEFSCGKEGHCDRAERGPSATIDEGSDLREETADTGTGRWLAVGAAFRKLDGAGCATGGTGA